jgi:uncharacterized membrane protein YozB (DUF420 family)
MLSLLEVPGFLGTNASLLSDLSLILCLISLILFVIAGFQAKNRQFKKHCPTQTIALILVILAVVLFMSPVYTQQYESTSAGLSPFLPNGLVSLHAGLGGLTLLYGVYVTLVGYRVFKSKHKKLLMQIASVLFIILNISGIVIYLNLYL